MTKEELQDKLKEIRQSFRLLMNGVTSQSLRDKGQDYRINWGASLLHLQEMAQEYPHDYELAANLWKDDVRECKILATMLMPHDAFPVDLALLWIEQTKTQEIAEIATRNLYQYLPYASDMAYQLISSPEYMDQLHGFTILGSLFSKKMMPTDRDINEFLDQAMATLQGDNLSLKHSAMNAVMRFADIDETALMVAKGALKTIKMDGWL